MKRSARIEPKITKTRQITLWQNNKGVHVEDIPTKGKIQDYLKSTRSCLRLMRKTFPSLEWSMHIEEHCQKGKDTHYRILEVVSGELQHSVL